MSDDCDHDWIETTRVIDCHRTRTCLWCGINEYAPIPLGPKAERDPFDIVNWSPVPPTGVPT